MISANTIKYIQSLRLGKFRQKYNKFIAEGDKCCIEFLTRQVYTIDAIYATDIWLKNNKAIAQLQSDKIVEIDMKAMHKITQLKTPTNVLIVCNQLTNDINKTLLNNESILYLDGIQNPGNMGTMIRTADWYGVNQIVCSTDTVDYYHPKVVQAAMGSHNRVAQFTADLGELHDISPLQILGTSLDGKPIDRSQSQPPYIVVIGNEGQGIRPEHMKLIDQKILIEGANGKIAESLNAGIACAIVLDRLFG